MSAYPILLDITRVHVIPYPLCRIAICQVIESNTRKWLTSFIVILEHVAFGTKLNVEIIIFSEVCTKVVNNRLSDGSKEFCHQPLMKKNHYDVA